MGSPGEVEIAKTFWGFECRRDTWPSPQHIVRLPAALASLPPAWLLYSEHGARQSCERNTGSNGVAFNSSISCGPNRQREHRTRNKWYDLGVRSYRLRADERFRWGGPELQAPCRPAWIIWLVCEKPVSTVKSVRCHPSPLRGKRQLADSTLLFPPQVSFDLGKGSNKILIGFY